MIALEFYVYHFLLSSVYTSLVYVACRFSINIIEDSRATKLRFVQHATGLPETGRIVQQVCKASFFPLTIALTSFVLFCFFFRKIRRLHLSIVISLINALT